MSLLTDYRIKVILLGDSGVGKTTISNLFTQNEIDYNLTATIGVGFASKEIILNETTRNPETKENKEVVVQLWDTAGSERFAKLIKGYLRDVHIAIFVCDLTSKESFNNLEKWKETLEEFNHDNYTNMFYPIEIIVATKADRKHPEVSYMDVEALARKWECPCYIGNLTSMAAKDLVYRIIYQAVKDFDFRLEQLAQKDPERIPKEFKESSIKKLQLSLETKLNKSRCCY